MGQWMLRNQELQHAKHPIYEATIPDVNRVMPPPPDVMRGLGYAQVSRPESRHCSEGILPGNSILVATDSLNFSEHFEWRESGKKPGKRFRINKRHSVNDNGKYRVGIINDAGESGWAKET